MLLIAFLAIVIEIMPMIKNKQGKEAAVLLLLGAITLAYGYYYSTHRYTASLVNTMLDILKLR